MWLQPTEEIVEHLKDNDDYEAIITKELKSHLNGLLYKKEDKGKKKRTLEEFFFRERDFGPLRESY